jgi:hypothetical protein
MKNRTTTLAFAVLATGALGTPASAQAVSQDETYTLAEVGGRSLPAVTGEEDGCREEVVAATLTLEADGDWILVMQEREACGDRVEEDEEREEGTYRMEDGAIRFLDDDEDDDQEDEDDEQDEDDLDLDDLTTGSRTAGGLTVRLEDSDAVLVFRR